tara:strand:+ start:812 stop:1048 length:237 start_codon:yes stop_codon:yes gene_type:complete
MSNNNLHELDLHGVAHDEVESLCHKFMSKHWCSQDEGHIITGNSLIMKEIVTNALKQYDIRFEEGQLNNAGYYRMWFE